MKSTKHVKKILVVLLILFIPITIYFNHIYGEVSDLVDKYPGFYSFLKREAEDYTGKGFDLTTRRGLLKVKMRGDFMDILDELYQNRYNKLGKVEGFYYEEDDGESQHHEYLYFQTRLIELIVYNGKESGLY
ncbi:hypothetical protein [Miniphocaeibacter massiliensis]|uniref:hypothetical protein n=1 Tax=Miniphocaeibacter massiliensis TaxID=2041841 RepID=UPI000C1C57B5|nr:hypothetical protein [Miniphocaeibacter massiliensis]